MTLKATPRIKITKWKFREMLLAKHKGQVEHSPYSENLYDGNPPAQMTLYYSPEGHCATWMNGEGWEFITTNTKEDNG